LSHPAKLHLRPEVQVKVRFSENSGCYVNSNVNLNLKYLKLTLPN
jgi:hypothetical protein